MSELNYQIELGTKVKALESGLASAFAPSEFVDDFPTIFNLEQLKI